MALMTGEQRVEDIRRLDLQIYTFGEKIESPVDHPIPRPSLNSVRMIYSPTQNPQYGDLMTVTSTITGNKINRFCHIHYSMQDLVNKVKTQRLLGQKTTSRFQRCIGMDAFNALYSITFETDQQYKTNYFENFKKFTVTIEENDQTVNGTVTDLKSDRSLAPHAQSDADMYLHVVERRPDDITVHGAKTYQTGIIDSHEAIVMPTIAMGPDDEDYAVSFTVPTDVEGIFMVIDRQSCDTRKLEDSETGVGNSELGGMEALVMFGNVFIPNDRIFLSGEVEFAEMLVERFVDYHKQSYDGYRVGVGDVLIGVAALVVEYNGVEHAFAVRNRLIEMIHLNETLLTCGIACSSGGKPTPSDNYLIDLLLINVCKQSMTRLPCEIIRLAENIAGGLVVIAPSEKDLRDLMAGSYVDKYLCDVNTASTGNRLRVLCLIESMSLGTATIGYRTESMHGASSPQAQCIMITRQGNIGVKKKLAKAIVYID